MMKKQACFAMILCLIASLLGSPAIMASEEAVPENIEFYFVPQTMREDGEIDVLVNVRNVPAVLEGTETGICSFNFRVRWDAEQFFLKTGQDGVPMLTAGGNMLVDKQDDLTIDSVTEQSLAISFLDSTLGENLITRDGPLMAFTLVSKSPQRLWNSNDSYPLRFVPGSVGAILYHLPSYSVRSFDRTAGIDVPVGGYNTLPSLQSPGIDKSFAFTAGSSQMLMGEDAVAIDAVPFMEEGTLMLPIRFLSENAGMTVTWEESTRQAVAACDYKTLVIQLSGSGAAKIYINAKPCEVLPPPVERDGRIYVPAELVLQLFGTEACVEPEGNSVRIYLP